MSHWLGCMLEVIQSRLLAVGGLFCRVGGGWLAVCPDLRASLSPVTVFCSAPVLNKCIKFRESSHKREGNRQGLVWYIYSHERVIVYAIKLTSWVLKWATMDLAHKQLFLLHLECLNLQKGLGERMFSGSYRSGLQGDCRLWWLS